LERILLHFLQKGIVGVDGLKALGIAPGGGAVALFVKIVTDEILIAGYEMRTAEGID
jgi:hypothetical protein